MNEPLSRGKQGQPGVYKFKGRDEQTPLPPVEMTFNNKILQEAAFSLP